MPWDDTRITVRETAKGKYTATYIDPDEPWVTYTLHTFDRKRIPRILKLMTEQRAERIARESLLGKRVA